jgi:group II intron reverse transcriptase/maturase
MARREASFRFTNLAHLLTVEHLHEAHRRVRRGSAPGVDRVTADEYGQDLDGRIGDLHARLVAGTYRASPVRRVHIPKDGGRTRPIGIPTYEDKIVQRAVAMLLEPIFEQDFLDCSFGFRPGRGAHRALDRLWHVTMDMHGGWALDVDLRDFFGSLGHDVIQQFVASRVVDGRIRRLIGRWLNAGVMEKGAVSMPVAGTPQGGVISPLLANIVLHHVLDVWFVEQVRPRLRGPAAMVRYADDLVMVFREQDDALRVAEVLRKRLGRFGLAVNEEKTRMVRFERPRLNETRRRRGEGANGTFDFLGFTHYWRRTHRGIWVLYRKTMRARFARVVQRIAWWCRKHRHQPIDWQHAQLCRQIQGHYAYYGIRGNVRALKRVQHHSYLVWQKWLGRRSQRGTLTKVQREAMARRWPIPQPRIGAFWTSRASE